MCLADLACAGAMDSALNQLIFSRPSLPVAWRVPGFSGDLPGHLPLHARGVNAG